MQKTIFNIIWAKFLESLESASLYNIFVITAKVFSWGLISLFLINTPVAIEKLATLIKWYDFAIVKILVTYIIIFFWPLFTAIGKKVIEWIKSNIPEMPVHGPQYMGIPVIELVDYIFTTTTYSRNEFCTQFSVSRKVFDDLANGMDRIGVFIRGANNARVLCSDFSRSDISAILNRASESGEIRPLIRATKNGYTHTPSMQEIIKRSPSPFTTYRIPSKSTELA